MSFPSVTCILLAYSPRAFIHQNNKPLLQTNVKKTCVILETDFNQYSYFEFQVFGSTIYSSCSDGQVYCHSFPTEGAQPHYEMAVDADTDSCTSVLLNRENRSMAADPEQSTEICEGPKRCKTGKTGLVKSSSSFQVNFVSMLLFKHFQNSIIVFFWSQ